MNAIAKTDDYTSVLQKRLSDRIKANFIEMIPEEEFDKMLARAMDDLMNGPHNKRYVSKSIYVTKDDPRNNTGRDTYIDTVTPELAKDYNVMLDKNTIPGMIYADLFAKASKSVAAVLEKPEWSNAWSDQSLQNNVEAGVSKIITENADVFMKSLMAGIIRTAMNNTLGVLRNDANKMQVF